jgi:DNA polymerase elongation subunit (family B)
MIREFARVFGVDFFSVISRGSQFKVESFMFRIAKPESFVLISPSRHDVSSCSLAIKSRNLFWSFYQVGKQNAAECMPLIMEPASAFYSSPLVVLDFQSLYPSIMIAYNYCYSTCLGRVREFQGAYKLGVNDNFDIPPELLQKLQDHITGDCRHTVFLSLNSQENDGSCGEWHHVCETQGAERLAREDVDGVIGHQNDGETSNEECKWRQSTFF